MHHPCLIPLSIFILLLSPCSSRTFTFCSMHSILVSLFFPSVNFFLRMSKGWISSLGWNLSSSWWYRLLILHVQDSSQYYSQHSQVVLGSFAPSVSRLCSPSASSIFSSGLFVKIQLTIFAACAKRLMVQRSFHFVALGFTLRAIIVTSLKSLGHWVD